MKLLVFAATTSRESINRQLLNYAERLLADGLVEGELEIESIDLNDYEMPIYSADREKEDGIPDAARDFFDRVGAADAVLISFAEHNGFYTAAYKNVFDWASRIDMRVYQDKPAVLFSTSIGPSGGANVLKTAVMSGQFFGYDVKASLSIPSFHDNFDLDTGVLRDADLDGQFRAALASLGDDSATGVAA
ncbi:MAG: NAD(P)H-dependent oxidoreductase [Actinomycetota bacterium]